MSLPVNIIGFSAVEATRNQLKHNGYDSVTASAIGGAVGGFFSLSIIVPTDLLKCRAQMSK